MRPRYCPPDITGKWAERLGGAYANFVVGGKEVFDGI